jgi:2,4-dienoyl-CoA reductase-like NADH-dependent reductase (Old Yellow Enzyme family)
VNLFDELKIRSVTLRNRIIVSPMCQYSSTDGFATDWHLVHLGSRAVGGAAAVIAEATAVTPEGRISPADLGIWKDPHIEMLARIATFVRAQGAAPGIQLAHAGRKASVKRPWEGGGAATDAEGGWAPVAPSAIPFEQRYRTPVELDEQGIRGIVDKFAAAAKRAEQAGFQIIEIHAAHGYLIHQFLSPLSNRRADAYGGSFHNRTRFAREVVTAVRRVWPSGLPVFVRISATDWVPGGWDVEQSVELAKQLKGLGADLIDCSSGGTAPQANIPMRPGYQVPFAEKIRREAGVMTGAVGMITDAKQADEIVREGKADVVLLAREFLRQPYWPMHAAQELRSEIAWPAQYLRAAPPETRAR